MLIIFVVLELVKSDTWWKYRVQQTRKSALEDGKVAEGGVSRAIGAYLRSC